MRHRAVLRTLICIPLVLTLLAFPTEASAAAKPVAPNPQLSPGAIDPSAQTSTVCASKKPSEQKINSKTKNSVYKEYKIGFWSKSNYSIDHLVPAELGGTNTKNNLWADPRKGPNSVKSKHTFQDHLRGLVCSGQVSLTDAQQAVKTDWIAARTHYAPIAVIELKSATVSQSTTTSTTSTTSTTARQSTTTTTTSQPSSTNLSTTAPSSSPTTSSYTNVDGNKIESPDANTSGATFQCGDGTYSHAAHSQGACSHHGGIAQRF